MKQKTMTKEENILKQAEFNAALTYSENDPALGDYIFGFREGYETAEKQQDGMMIKFAEHWEEQKQIWKGVLDRPLFHTKEDQIKASASYMALNAMLLNFKETFKNSLKQ